MKEAIGDRMKDQYENRTRYFLPRRTYTIIRADGKAFHTFTRGFNKPFDHSLVDAMNYTAEKMCEEIQGAAFAYVQSDEISLLLTDFANIGTSAWFDGNIQKMASVSASIATAYFNQKMREQYPDMDPIAMFDSRVFTIPDPVEAENYFVWRQQDCIRNSISMVAQSLYSHKELHGKNTGEMQEMSFKKGVNWNNVRDDLKRGRFVMKETFESPSGQIRSRWFVSAAFEITKERERFSEMIPRL